jgi:hypothetical protein
VARSSWEGRRFANKRRRGAKVQRRIDKGLRLPTNATPLQKNASTIDLRFLVVRLGAKPYPPVLDSIRCSHLPRRSRGRR